MSTLNPKLHGGGGEPDVVFCPLHKISLGNTYLKMFYLAKLFVADAPGKKIVFLPLKAV